MLTKINAKALTFYPFAVFSDVIKVCRSTEKTVKCAWRFMRQKVKREIKVKRITFAVQIF